jgi:hypothetical protein
MSREDTFHLSQAKQRALIRIQSGRARPIDILAMNVSLATDSTVAEQFDASGFSEFPFPSLSFFFSLFHLPPKYQIIKY